MKELSKEIIEVDGKEYTLFLNRKGIVAWEKMTKISKVSEAMENKYSEIANNNDEISIDENNPFAGTEEEFSKIEEDSKKMEDVYAKFYWIALYETHKLTLNESYDVFNKAIEEYGLEQLASLAAQMIEDVNNYQYGKNLKKLTALRPAK